MYGTPHIQPSLAFVPALPGECLCKNCENEHGEDDALEMKM